MGRFTVCEGPDGMCKTNTDRTVYHSLLKLPHHSHHMCLLLLICTFQKHWDGDRNDLPMLAGDKMKYVFFSTGRLTVCERQVPKKNTDNKNSLPLPQPLITSLGGILYSFDKN